MSEVTGIHWIPMFDMIPAAMLVPMAVPSCMPELFKETMKLDFLSVTILMLVLISRPISHAFIIQMSIRMILA